MGIAQADLAMSKSADKVSVMPGDTLTYTLTTTNVGTHAAEQIPGQTQILVTDNMPPELENVIYSMDNGATWDTWSGSIELPLINPGDSVSILIQGTVNLYAEGVISNTASVAYNLLLGDYGNFDPDTSNNTSDLDIPITPIANIAVTKLSSPSQVMAGEIITYTLIISNTGPSDSENIVLTDTMSRELLNPEISFDGGNTWQPWISPYSLGTLAYGAVLSLLIRATVSSWATTSVSNTAKIDSDTYDPDNSDNTSTVDTPVNELADLLITKEGNQSPVLAGEVLTYTLKIMNLGPSDAQNVVIEDDLPSNIINAEYSLDNGVSWSPWNGYYLSASLVAGTGSSLLIQGTVLPSATGTLVNTATISSDTPDPNPDNNSDTLITPINTSADLVMTKTAPPYPVSLGGTLIYTIFIENLGPNDALNVIVEDTLPAELSAIEFSTDNGYSWQPWGGSYSVGTIPANATESILIQGTVVSEGDGLITNTATVSSDTPDPDPSNNNDTAVAAINYLADLELTKVVDKEDIFAGEMLTYTIQIENLGIDDAENVVLTDNIAEILLAPEVSLDGLNWTNWVNPYALGTIPSGAINTLWLRGIVDSSLAVQSITNTATISSDTPDPDVTNNSDSATTQISTSADIQVVKIGDKDDVIAGNTLTYTLEITNLGPSDAQNVVLIDHIPSGILSMDYSMDDGVTWLKWHRAHLLGTLLSGATETILIRGLVNPSSLGIVSNTATIGSTTPDRDVSNNTSTEQTDVNASADVAITKTAIDPSFAGGALIYTIVITNNGPSFASDVTITDVMPVGISNVEYSLDGSFTWFAWADSLNIGTVSLGGAVTVLIRGTVAQGLQGSIVNTIEVTATTPDPNPSNNTSTIEVSIEKSADLSITKTSDVQQVMVGDIVIYTLFVKNNGPSDAEDVTIADILPSELENAEFSIDNGTTWTTWNNYYDITFFEAGSQMSILIRGIIAQNAVRQITNKATVDSETPDPDSSNNTTTLTIRVTEPREQAITDLIQSVAFQEAALSHILNAEGEKMQVIISMPNATKEQLMALNDSVCQLINSVTRLEMILQSKLELFVSN